MIKLRKLLVMSLISSIIGSNCFGQTLTSPGVVFLEAGVKTPFQGYLFPPDETILMKKELMELDELRALADSYQKSIDDYKKNEDLFNFKVNTLLDQNDKLSNAMYKQEDRNKYENWFWFGMGIVATGLSVYLAERLK